MPFNRFHTKVARIIMIITALFIVASGIGLYCGSQYIKSQLLLANENMAVDIAQLVKNNFKITDAEVAYMKTLTFNEMEVDPINKRLMDVGNSVKLNTDIINVYLLASLSDDEIKYSTDLQSSEFLGYDVGTRLNGIWLLNGKIDDNGYFIAAQRDDIYRYTRLTTSQEKGLLEQLPFSEFSADAWGNFITGYSPVFTEEGSFVGLLGIDMDPDKYQASAEQMILMLFTALIFVALVMISLFLLFYFKYIRAKEGQLYFNFYSRMSHDMRTPMNGILGMASLSRDENDINTLHRNLAHIEEAGQYMLALINDTLDVQKLSSGHISLYPKIQNAREFMENLTALIRLEAQKKNIEFEFVNKGLMLDTYVFVDELRIQQIFINLASNAIKFTHEGGKVTFIGENLGEDSKICHLRFTISDTGVGMSREFIRDRLFTPFAQEQNSVTTQYGGSGLGMSIVKNLIELMNGRIEVVSEQGKGTTFTVFLDVAIASPEDVQKEKEKQAEKTINDYTALNNMHILLCEDHPLNAEIAIRMLKRVGCTVDVAKNGQEGVEMFAASEPGTYDAVLMDIRMPIMDGLTATKEIRKLPREDAASVAIIAMTANAYSEDIQNCLDAGMNAHIGKPISMEVLFKTLKDNIKSES